MHVFIYVITHDVKLGSLMADTALGMELIVRHSHTLDGDIRCDNQLLLKITQCQL